MGFSYQPTHAATGIGLWTGAYADLCFSESKAMDYDTFTETSLYIPAHISFRIPVGYVTAPYRVLSLNTNRVL